LIFELRFLAGNEYIENRNLVNQQVGGIILAGKGGLGKFDRDDYIIKMPKDGKMETPAKNDNPCPRMGKWKLRQKMTIRAFQ
jgi:hypothetical protein